MRFFTAVRVVLAVTLVTLVVEGATKKKPTKSASASSTIKPSLEETYAGYNPPFSWERKAKKAKVRFSRQKWYMNVGDVQSDMQVWPILKKADELVKKKEYRRATPLYRRILKEYPDDLVRIADEGIFVPAWLYAQRKILRYPPKELEYYRMLYDPEAKPLYDRARRRFSIYDYKLIEKFHLATSYGDDALFALGNMALDAGKFDEAKRYYERILSFHGAVDNDRDKISLPRDQVWARLALCYKKTGEEEASRKALEHVRNKKDRIVRQILSVIRKVKFNATAYYRSQNIRSDRYDTMDDRMLSDDMPYPFSSNRGQWRAALASRSWVPSACEPEALPWATETDLIYKDYNGLYSRSLITGELNWSFVPGGSNFDWDMYTGYRQRILFYPDQPILVYNGVVFAHMFVYGPSLVAVDQFTGKLLWAKGPMAARTEHEWLDRFQTAPAAARGAVIAPVVHDDIRGGRTHVASTAEIAAYEPRTGKLIWRRWIARISPMKITQSRYPRKIRILSSPPLVRDGVVYHCTNAGVVAALDEKTGNILWATRYPQDKSVLDNLSGLGETWRNMPPLLRGRRLYVTPLDAHLLLCMDKNTGKILWTASQSADSRLYLGHNQRRHAGFPKCWRLCGFTPEGDLVLSGYDIVILDGKTGRKKWVAGFSAINAGYGKRDGPTSEKFSRAMYKRAPKGYEPGITGEGGDYWAYPGRVYSWVRITRNNRLYFAMQAWYRIPWPCQGPFNSEYCMDLKKKEILWQRKWYHPPAFIMDYPHAPPLAKRVLNEEPEPFHPASRMTFTRWGVPFEVDVTAFHITVRYDRRKLMANLAQRTDLFSLFAKAEMARQQGDIGRAVALYEQCKKMLPSEEEEFRKSINQRLYPLYAELGAWGYQAMDYGKVETSCKNMGDTSSTPQQEMKALLAYADYYERTGKKFRALHVLQNLIRHYWKEPLGISGLLQEKKETVLERARKGLAHLFNEIPAPYRKAAEQIYSLEKEYLNDGLLTVNLWDVAAEKEIREVAVERIKHLLSGADEAFRKQYQQQASQEIKAARTLGPTVMERVLWCWPRSDAGTQAVKELVDTVPLERKWLLADAAEACGLGKVAGVPPLKEAPPPSEMESGEGWGLIEAKNTDPDMVRLILPQKGETAETASLLFVGGRKKKAYGNKFTVSCWDMKTGKKVWETEWILLGRGATSSGSGSETGFEEIFMKGDLAVVHGRFDVVGIKWKAGVDENNGKKKVKWHYRTPKGFEIVSVGMCGDVMVLCGRKASIGVLVDSGRQIWEETEKGEIYGGPFFHGDEVITVRNNPALVAIRKVGSGRLVSRVMLPGLTLNRKHPIYAIEGGEESNPAAAEATAAYPVAFGNGYVAVTDGRNYHVVDVGKRMLVWSRPATKLMPTMDPSYRMWISDNKMVVLKPYYSVLENVVFDLKTGEMLWRRREGGKKAEGRLRKQRGRSADKTARGLVVYEMVVSNGIAYGAAYQMGATTITIVGMDIASGKKTMEIKQKGYENPEVYIFPSWSKDCITVKVQDGNKFEIWQVDVKKKKIIQRIETKGFGRLNNYGDVSMTGQGPYLAVWTFAKHIFSSPSGNKGRATNEK